MSLGAFSVYGGDPGIPVIAHIPHSSTSIPSEILQSILLNDGDLKKELLKMTDSYTDELFGSANKSGVTTFVNNISRLVFDPERFVNDEEEIMARVGMGALYTKLSDGKILRELTTFDRKMLMDRYYYPYHRAFKMQVQKILEAFGFCLIIDCHSFPSRPLPYEMDQDPARSDICIGTDTYHSPKNFTDILVKFFKSEGFSVAVNKPFAGTIVPVEFYRKKPEVQSLMIEINRRLYMNEDTGARINSFDSAKQSISRLFQNLKEIFLSQPGPMGKLNGTMSGGKGLTL